MAVLFSQIFDRLSVDLVFFIVPAFFPVFGVHHSTQSYQGSLIKAAVFYRPGNILDGPISLAARL
jgi:hypothetical protein